MRRGPARPRAVERRLIEPGAAGERLRPGVQLIRLGRTAQLAHYSRVILESHDQRGIISTVRFLLNRQSAAEQCLGLEVSALLVVQQREIVEPEREIRMVRAQDGLLDGQRPVV